MTKSGKFKNHKIDANSLVIGARRLAIDANSLVIGANNLVIDASAKKIVLKA